VASQAIKLGYRGFHDALSYCNQAGLGAAVKDSGIGRENFFLMSMVPTYLMGFNETISSVEASLAQMQLEYLDLVMVHHRAPVGVFPRRVSNMKNFPTSGTRPKIIGGTSLWSAPPCAGEDPTYVKCQDETWDALVEMKKRGRVKSIGVSNWEVPTIQRMLARGVELPSVNQIEVHVGWHNDPLIAFCQKHGIVVQAATPLARSMNATTQMGADATVTALAQKYRKSPAQISLRYLLERGIAIIPSAHSVAYLQENLDLFSFRLTSDEVAALGRINTPCRTCVNCYKCWGDPAALMCTLSNGSMMHCP
jgi:diketogulonate reductase-like aldo/keto reductase